jgi:hypothetical protein
LCLRGAVASTGSALHLAGPSDLVLPAFDADPDADPVPDGDDGAALLEADSFEVLLLQPRRWL